MVFTSLPGEPDMEVFAATSRARGCRVMVPEDDPDPHWLDVVIVPGVAFTAIGDRLGQGGGWYDRFLPRTRPDCAHIGVAFELQVTSNLPTETHDVRLHGVVTDRHVWWATQGARR